jgi:hypothetical protein
MTLKQTKQYTVKANEGAHTLGTGAFEAVVDAIERVLKHFGKLERHLTVAILTASALILDGQVVTGSLDITADVIQVAGGRAEVEEDCEPDYVRSVWLATMYQVIGWSLFTLGYADVLDTFAFEEMRENLLLKLMVD